MQHEFNRQDLRPIEFLFEVMHDRSVPMEQRIDAADKLQWLTDPRPPAYTIRIPPIVPEPERVAHRRRCDKTFGDARPDAPNWIDRPRFRRKAAPS